MNPMLMAMASGGGLAAALFGDDANHSRINTGDCYAGVSLNSDGTEYAFSNAGSATGTSMALWMLSGENTNYWARCTLNSGTLDASNSGTGSWIALSSTLSWAIIRDTTGTDAADFDLEIATDASGSPVIVAATNYTLSANRTA